MGFPELLTLIFVTLKLTHVISWSWWWVVSPELISIGFGLFLLLSFLGVLGVAAKADSKD